MDNRWMCSRMAGRPVAPQIGRLVPARATRAACWLRTHVHGRETLLFSPQDIFGKWSLAPKRKWAEGAHSHHCWEIGLLSAHQFSHVSLNLHQNIGCIGLASMWQGLMHRLLFLRGQFHSFKQFFSFCEFKRYYDLLNAHIKPSHCFLECDFLILNWSSFSYIYFLNKNLFFIIQKRRF